MPAKVWDTGYLIRRVNSLVDDTLPSEDIVEWLNEALDDLGAAVGATFPHLSTTESTVEPAIPQKWRPLLVLFAAARAKEQDSSIAEADRFMVQYEAKKNEFVASYIVPNTYDDRALVTSVTGETLIGLVDGENKTFITANKPLKKDSLTVYVNGQEVEVASVNWTYGLVTLKDAPASAPTADYQYFSTRESFNDSISESPYPPNPFGWSW